MLLEVKNVKKVYGRGMNTTTALNQMNLEIDENEFVAIMGESGSGKSTLLNLIATFDRTTEGLIKLDGLPLNQLKNKDIARFRREMMGFVFQDFNVLNTMSNKDNILMPLVLANERPKIMQKRLTEISEQLGIEDLLEKYPSEISGGQKQRVAIARALANDPKILISDESTSALDPKTTKQILALLQDLNQKLGLTVVLITHEMQIVKDIANRVAVMQDGRLIEEGSVLEIFSDPKQPLTQDFISTATGIDEAMVKIEKQEIVEHLSENSILVQLKYAGASTDEPLLNELYKHYQVTANILYGNIEILDGTPVGELVVVLSGEKTALAGAQEAIRQAGVQLKVLKGGQ